MLGVYNRGMSRRRRIPSPFPRVHPGVIRVFGPRLVLLAGGFAALLFVVGAGTYVLSRDTPAPKPVAPAKEKTALQAATSSTVEPLETVDTSNTTDTPDSSSTASAPAAASTTTGVTPTPAASTSSNPNTTPASPPAAQPVADTAQDTLHGLTRAVTHLLGGL